MKGRVISTDLERRIGWILGEDEHMYRFWAGQCPPRVFDELPNGRYVNFVPDGTRVRQVEPVKPITPASGERRLGFVKRLHSGYAIVKADDGRTYFVSRAASKSFGQLVLDQGVTFKTFIRRSDRGQEARDVVALNC